MTQLLACLVMTTISSLLLGSASGFGSGCPKGCVIPTSPEPGHGTITNSNANEVEKYTITVNLVRSGEYEVILQGPPFKGFVMNVDGGMFQSVPETDFSVTECGGGSAITQSNPLTKDHVKLFWKQPKSGPVTFRATVVKNYNYAVINIEHKYTI